MEPTINVSILPNHFLREDGTFDKEKAFILCGQIAGVCYDEEGFNHLSSEPLAKTEKRIKRTLSSGHHSVYDHIFVSLNLENIPKILAMVLNNEKQYTTSEKSARYTQVKKDENSVITEKEEELYNKWLLIFETQIKKKYSEVFKENKIRKLAQENARYLVTVFMPTQMIYTTSLRQINYLVAWMKFYIKNTDYTKPFEKKLALSMQELINNLEDLNILDERLMTNEKNRTLSLFKPINGDDYFSYIYNITYKGSFAFLAQAQRHRTINYQMNFLPSEEYFIPPIILDNNELTSEWLNDLHSVRDIYPQGQLVLINENGSYEDFLLKCKERLCTEAQLEIMLQTKENMTKYYQALLSNNHPLASDLILYTKGARCTFPDYNCVKDCHFKEGKTLKRKI